MFVVCRVCFGLDYVLLGISLSCDFEVVLIVIVSVLESVYVLFN